MNNKHSLGCYLRNIRTIKGYTLKDIERLTNRKIVNTYLSQIETGRIKQPDHDILIVLSELYKIDINILTKKAELPITITLNDDNESVSFTSDFVDMPTDWKDLVKKDKHNVFQSLNLTDYEEEELISYLAFLRTK